MSVWEVINSKAKGGLAGLVKGQAAFSVEAKVYAEEFHFDWGGCL
jgi:hypothetical protein